MVRSIWTASSGTSYSAQAGTVIGSIADGDMFDDDASIIKVYPPCLRKGKVELDKENNVEEELQSNFNEQQLPAVADAKEQRSVKPIEDGMINMEPVLDSNANGAGQLGPFEEPVNDVIMESSLEISYENYVEFEQIRKERLMTIAEGPEGSAQGTLCDSSAKDLEVARENDDMQSQVSRGGLSKRSVWSKISASSKQEIGSVSSKRSIAKSIGASTKRSVSSKITLSSKQGIRSVSSGKSSESKSIASREQGPSGESSVSSITLGDPTQQENGSVASKRTVSSKFSFQ